MNLQEFKTELLKCNYNEVVKDRIKQLTQKDYSDQIFYRNFTYVSIYNFRALWHYINNEISNKERINRINEWEQRKRQRQKEYNKNKYSYLE